MDGEPTDEEVNEVMERVSEQMDNRDYESINPEDYTRDGDSPEIRLTRTPEPGEIQWHNKKKEKVEKSIEKYGHATIYFGGEEVYRTTFLTTTTIQCLSFLYTQQKEHYEETGQKLKIEIGE